MSGTPTSPQPLGSSNNDSEAWHAFTEAVICTRLHTSPEHGLDHAEVTRRQSQYGYNELAQVPRSSLLRRLLEQFNEFIVIILLVAAVIAALMGDYIEAGAILAIVALNAVLGLIQEGRAEAALAALTKLAAPEAHVIRGGHRSTVPARELVPGDVVVLEAGNLVPADLRLIESANLRIEEAALTGESQAVEKDARLVLRQDASLGDRRNSAFMGTTVRYGRGTGVVVGVGMHTQIGLIATLLQRVNQEVTPLQRRFAHLGRILGVGVLAICAVVFALGVLHGDGTLEMFLIAVSLSVAAVPEGLPAVVTITLALGMREMVKRHALIRRLSSVETLGSTTVICSDKTGTLTQNVMTVTHLWADGVLLEVTRSDQAGPGVFRQDGQVIDLRLVPAFNTALWVAALANDAVIETQQDAPGGYCLVGDPTETALLMAVAICGATRASLERSYPRIGELPFDAVRKRMTTIHRIQSPQPEDISPFIDTTLQGCEAALTKGAPDIVLDLCTHYQGLDNRRLRLSDALRRTILQANETLANQALRVLALAYRTENVGLCTGKLEGIEHKLTFVGLVGMIDSPRPEVGSAIKLAQRAGIRTMMITGDYADTARAIAIDIGLINAGDRVHSGFELQAMSDLELAEDVHTTNVYARVSPEHKIRIVKALQQGGEIVAMTGDGVNDAPALKQADIGIAMGISGTDVAREASDMVLTDDNYASIVAAIEQGRVIYANIRKFVFYLLSCNMAEIMIILVAILAGLRSPLTAIQLLWLNLLTDGAPALALGIEKGDSHIMSEPPRSSREPIINRLMTLEIAIEMVVTTCVVLGVYLVGLRYYADIPLMADTMAFVTLSFSELLRAFSSRSEHRLLLHLGLFSNPMMFYSVAISVILLLLVVYVPLLRPIFNTVPLTWAQWCIVGPMMLIPTIVSEVIKVVVTNHLSLKRPLAP